MSPHSDTSRLRAMESDEQQLLHGTIRFLNMLFPTMLISWKTLRVVIVSFLEKHLVTVHSWNPKKRNYICDMNKSNTIFSEICLNRTLNKPKTCLNQTDLTVQSTQCLCNLNLCKPNSCLNWFIIGSIVFFVEISRNHTFLETEGVGE